MKKKTYILDQNTLNILGTLCRELGKKETQIIKEALRVYLESHNRNQHFIDSMAEAMSKMEQALERVAELSYKLGRCEERNRALQQEISRLKSGR